MFLYLRVTDKQIMFMIMVIKQSTKIEKLMPLESEFWCLVGISFVLILNNECIYSLKFFSYPKKSLKSPLIHLLKFNCSWQNECIGQISKSFYYIKSFKTWPKKVLFIRFEKKIKLL